MIEFQVNNKPVSFEGEEDTPGNMEARAPALTNAIFNASGVRIRKLPIKDQLKQAMS